MDIAIKEAVVDKLTFLVNGGQPETAHAGICWIIQHVIAQESPDGTYVDNYNHWNDIKDAVYKAWPKWTNSDCYPVPFSADEPERKRAAVALDEVANKWDRTTEYGANRLELVQLLLNAVIDSDTNHDHIHSTCEN